MSDEKVLTSNEYLGLDRDELRGVVRERDAEIERQRVALGMLTGATIRYVGYDCADCGLQIVEGGSICKKTGNPHTPPKNGLGGSSDETFGDRSKTTTGTAAQVVQAGESARHVMGSPSPAAVPGSPVETKAPQLVPHTAKELADNLRSHASDLEEERGKGLMFIADMRRAADALEALSSSEETSESRLTSTSPHGEGAA